ncbi:hypothetical protein ACWPKS_12965 [Coraliomargarita sp. W4R72]
MKKSIEPKTILVVRVMMPIMILVHFSAGVYSLYAASFFSEKIGSSLGATVASWIDGFRPHEQYSGLHCLAIERISTASLYFGAIIFFAILWFAAERRNGMNRRIVEHLKETDCEPVDCGQ